MKIFDWHMEKDRIHCAAIIVAAGSAQRMLGIDKIFADLNGKPVILRTIEAFQNSCCIDEIVLVARKDKLEYMASLIQGQGFSKIIAIVAGGDTRTESVQAGIRATSAKTVLVAVHDGARPLVTDDVICKAVDTALTFHAAAPAIRVKDTIKEIDEADRVIKTPDREMLRAVQTPQVFDKALLSSALIRARRENRTYTDDCGAMEGFGIHVHLTEGIDENIKITTPLDLKIAEMIVKEREAACALDTDMTSTDLPKGES